MDELNKRYFTEEESRIILNTYSCEIYIPSYYFEAKLAIQDGALYELFFIVKYRLIHDEKSDIAKLPIHDFLLPTFIVTKPDDILKISMDLYGFEENFVIFKYYKGGEIIHNRDIIKTAGIVERYEMLLNDGKIRAPYKKINDVTNNAQKIHDVKLNVPQYIQQTKISEIYRDKNDYSKPARLVMTVKDEDNFKLKALNMRENSAFTSTLAGVSFEDIKSMLTVADNRDDKNSVSMGRIEKAIRGLR
ncbi:MAG: hypothetical protein KGZ74_19475 [Chitinophagaceae bacterium]|nr:hypothetical protein [Chitinophagaceae bacterium]